MISFSVELWTPLLIANVVRLAVSSCPSDFPNEYSNHCYRISSDNAGFEESKAACIGSSGYLAKIYDMSESGRVEFSDILGGTSKWKRLFLVVDTYIVSVHLFMKMIIVQLAVA